MEQNMKCRSCGYLLQGLIDDRCPECGLIFDRADARTYRSNHSGPQRAGLFAGILGILISFLVFGVVALFVFKKSAGTSQVAISLSPPPGAPSSTPLNSAAKAGDLTLVQNQIDKGDDVNTRLVGDVGTALINAARHHHDEVVALLLENGADPDISTSQGPAILHAAHAANDGGLKTIEALIKGGADVDGVHQGWGYTALHRAIRFKSPKTVKLLLKHGADPLFGDGKGRTPLNIAKEVGNQQIITILEEAIASGDSKNEK